MRVFLTGGTGVLGRALAPILGASGLEVDAPRHGELDLFDERALAAAVVRADAIYHLATRIPAWERADDRDAWRENDRLRTETSRLLVDAALAGETTTYVQPTVTFVYPEGEVDEETPLESVPATLESAVDAEREAARFAAAGRRGVVLRLGLLDGAGTGNDEPDARFGATLHVDDAARALLAALGAPSGTYNVVRDGERVSNKRFKRATGWRPKR